ncbi:MAG: AAA domain-containing protein [Lawsonibacter sp.]|nr:AAA domain-containing protein [Lawsonibacter sp.]
MELAQLAGNDRIKEQLSRQEGGRGLSHAYILRGPAGSGRRTLARLLAAAMECTASRRPCGQCPQCRKVFRGIHPDVQTVGEDKAPLVDQVRALRSDAFVRPNEGARKIYLIHHAEEMNPSAQNAMLKLLEEGPPYAAFLLLAEGNGLLQTVRSRCEELSLAPVPLGVCEAWLARRFPEKTPQERRSAALACQGILGRAVDRLEDSGSQEARQTRVRALADTLVSASEGALLEAALPLEKESRDELSALLAGLEGELVRRLARERRPRVLRAAELTGQLRTALLFNANPGQLAGWLCAGMFARDGDGGTKGVKWS